VIGAGHDRSFAVDDEGVVWGSGLNSMGPIGVGTNMGFSLRTALVHTLKKVIGLNKEDLGGAEITQICGRELFALFLSSDGKVYVCGSSNDGRLGLANGAIKNRNIVPEPVLVEFLEPVSSNNPIVHISSGSRNSLVSERRRVWRTTLALLEKRIA